MKDTDSVLFDVWGERKRQDALWGEQNWADGTGGKFSRTREDLAKLNCETATRLGVLTWNDILEEEAAEVLACTNKDELRLELVQLAAVCVAWVEKLDREATHPPPQQR